MDRDARIEALRFLALSYVEQGMMDVARESVQLLLQEDRRYQAPPDDPGVFRNWVEALRPKAWYQKRWVQISSVAVVGGVLGFVLTGPGKEGPAPLPPPVLAPPSN